MKIPQQGPKTTITFTISIVGEINLGAIKIVVSQITGIIIYKPAMFCLYLLTFKI